MKAEAVRLPINFASDDPDCTHTVQIRQGAQLFPLDYECTETEANWLVDRFTDALAAHNAEASKWLPIETAPKDGTELLLFNKTKVPRHSIRLGRWYTPARLFQGRDGWWERNWIGSDQEGEPTHWQPLPEPPKEKDLIDKATDPMLPEATTTTRDNADTATPPTPH